MANTYIPLIKRTKWVDLSNEHKRLRETVEKDLRQGCCENGNIQPIMLQGAFGIGKSTTLYYLFHYGWEVLKTPTFYVPLAKIVEKVKEAAASKDSGRVENHELSTIISNMITAQIELLKNDNYSEISGLYFPEFKSSVEDVDLTLADYLQGFQAVEMDLEKNDCNLFEGIVFSADIIREALSSGHTPLLLVDEFESKFYELKRLVESSGGGILRELFDQIVQSHPFQLVICNGPASGYEVAKEKGGDDNNDSDTAANRRLKTIPIPFPTVALLKRKFMKGCVNGYVNFIWWMSRCRPGHIQKLWDAIDYDTFKEYDSSEFVAQNIFNEPIDESGEEVKYLKTDFFNKLDSHLFILIKDLLLNFEPRKVTLEKDYIDALKDSDNACNFYCTDELISIETVRSALQDDVSGYLLKCQERGKYIDINYLATLNKYFMYILSACSNENGEIAFNSPCKDSDAALTDTFLIPLFELTYDFVSQYEDSDDGVVKEVRDFLLDCIKHIEHSRDGLQVEENFPELSDLFDGFKVAKYKGVEVFIEFSLQAVREIMEQPIGSPALKYRDMSLEAKLEESVLRESVLLTNSDYNQKIIFIPVLDDADMDQYLNSLESYINDSLDDLHRKGNETLRIVYLQQNDKIDDLKERITKDGENVLPVVKYQKLTFENIDDYQFNFGGQITDFIDSVAKIVIVGNSCGDMSSLNGKTMDIKDAIRIIKDREWTKQKEVVRTIEHYEKLVCEGDNSVVKRVEQKSLEDYDSALSKAICDKADYEDNIPCDFMEVVDASVNDNISKYLALVYIWECVGKKEKPSDTIQKILESVGSHGSKTYFKPKTDVLEQSLYFDQIRTILSSPNTKTILKGFSKDDRFVKSIEAFTNMMKVEEPCENFVGFYSFIKDDLQEHWIGSYNEKMSYYGFVKGEVFMHLVYLNNYINAMDISSLRQKLNELIKVIDTDLTKAKADIASIISAITDILYFRKARAEDVPFSGYIAKLQEVSKLLNLCKRLLVEETNSFSVHCLVWSIVNRLSGITNSVKSLLQQLTYIRSSLGTAKQNIETAYQTSINTIYDDPLAAKLINYKASSRQAQAFKGYNGDYCWYEFVRSFKRCEEAQSILHKELDPVLETSLKREDITAFSFALTQMQQEGSKYKKSMDEVLGLCSEGQEMAQSYSTLRSYVENLISEDNNG